MRDLLNSIKADLVDPRLRVLVGLALLLLVGAVGYAKLGGSSSEATAPSSAPVTATTHPTSSGPAVTAAPAANPNAAAAETTYGTTYQHHGKLLNPFKTLPAPKAKPAAKPATPKASTSTPAASTPAAAPKTTPPAPTHAGGSTPAPAAPVKPKTRTEYRVTVEIGPAPANSGETPHLTAYKNVKIGQPLPSKADPVIVLKSATIASDTEKPAAPDGTATFSFNAANPPILNGPASCLPSSTQCEAFKLTTLVPEELQFAEADGQTVTYLVRLTLVSQVTVAV